MLKCVNSEVSVAPITLVQLTNSPAPLLPTTCQGNQVRMRIPLTALRDETRVC